MDFCSDEDESYMHSEENRLVMNDGYLREISWERREVGGKHTSLRYKVLYVLSGL